MSRRTPPTQLPPVSSSDRRYLKGDVARPEDQKAAWDEARVVRVFREWLEADGWTVEVESDFLDLLATRHEERLLVEAKGRTTGRPGSSVDLLYGQILRRMALEDLENHSVRFALVAPERLEAALLRVPPRIRESRRIDLFVVTDDDRVRGVVERSC